MFHIFCILMMAGGHWTTAYIMDNVRPQLYQMEKAEIEKLVRIKRADNIDQSTVILNNALSLHYYPNPFRINNIPLPGSNCTVASIDNVFYLANIIGVLNKQVDESSCLSFCILTPRCFSVNYLSDKSLCFLLASGLTMTDVEAINIHDAVYNNNLTSRHYLISRCFDDNGKPRLKIPSAPVVIPMPVELKSQCGISSYQPVLNNPSMRIVGGSTASPHSWPWIASLQSNGDHFCGGSIFRVLDGYEETDIVLTAAHCVTDNTGQSRTIDRFSVKLGAQSMSTGEEGAVRMPVDQFIVHPKYDPDLTINDVALLLLKRPVKFSKIILPVCLAKTQETTPPVNGICVELGWGNTIGANAQNGSPDLLQQLVAPVLFDNTCSRPDVWGLLFNPNTSLCAGYLEGKRNICTGDSGGPIQCKSTANSRYVQYGVASFVGKAGCPAPMKPGVFARVSTYYTWIMQTSALLSRIGKDPRLLFNQQ